MHTRACLLAVSLLLQACHVAPGGSEQTPVLEFPETGVDDPDAYEGYTTRFFRDARGNTLQVYLNQTDGRVVYVWANAVNESAAFTVRDAEGRPQAVTWGGSGALVQAEGPNSSVRHRLVVDAGVVEIGWFLLGTMRQERDFQYMGWHRRPFGDPPFMLRELTDLVESLARLPAGQQAEHLALLGASDAAELRSRLEPRATLSEEDSGWRVLVEHTSLDGRNRLTLELSSDDDNSTATVADDHVSIRSSDLGNVELEVTVTTDSEALTPLGPGRLFNEAFKDYSRQRRQWADSLRRVLASEQAPPDPRLVAFRRFERQVLGLELLSSEEKLLASLPNYATYFGRDQMMSALMLEPISSIDVQELVIASVLRKLSRGGNASHEEALGGQAIRENAAEYAQLIRLWEEARGREPAEADVYLARAGTLLRNLQAVRENYRMVDDDFQLPILLARYLSREDTPAGRKRAFLAEPAGSGESRLDAIVRNLAFVTMLATPYAEQPRATNLVGFYHRDDQGWVPGSWRDSRAGYGNGRYAMDVNVVWVPNALAALEQIIQTADTLGLSIEEALSRVPENASTLESYIRDPAGLDAAIATWRAARRHFEVHLDATEIRRRVDAMLDLMPGPERTYWRRRIDEAETGGRPLSFLALSLDRDGRPVAAVNTDPATALFLEDYTEQVLQGESDPAAVLEMIDTFVRPYPVGLFVGGLGPLVVNDAYAGQAVQQRFREDLYHSPRVVWGREVNLLLLGLARQIGAAYDESGRLRNDGDEFRSYVDALRHALTTTAVAVEASGLSHNELWSYRIDDGTLRPTRYGASSDIQLWNVTDLAVQFLMDRLPPQ